MYPPPVSPRRKDVTGWASALAQAASSAARASSAGEGTPGGCGSVSLMALPSAPLGARRSSRAAGGEVGALGPGARGPDDSRAQLRYRCLVDVVESGSSRATVGGGRTWGGRWTGG